jgi:hypothetical protein
MASGPCEPCSAIISHAQEASHAYNKALDILEDLGSTPWVYQAGGVETADFWSVFEALRNLRDIADRRIPSGDY